MHFINVMLRVFRVRENGKFQERHQESGVLARKRAPSQDNNTKLLKIKENYLLFTKQATKKIKLVQLGLQTNPHPFGANRSPDRKLSASSYFAGEKFGNPESPTGNFSRNRKGETGKTENYQKIMLKTHTHAQRETVKEKHRAKRMKNIKELKKIKNKPNQKPNGNRYTNRTKTAI